MGSKKYCPYCDSTAVCYIGIQEDFTDDETMRDTYECDDCGLCWQGFTPSDGMLFDLGLLSDTPENSNDKGVC
jgi:hypothetical protein